MRYLIAESSWSGVALARSLSGGGTLVTRVEDAGDLPGLIDATDADLVLIDAADLARDGLGLPALRRRRGDRPLAVLAQRPGRAQCAAWIRAGADTVIDSTTPTEETAMRLQAVARRAHGLAGPVLRAGRLSIDLTTRRAACNGVTLHLGPKVYEILEYIALRRGRLVTRDALLTHVYGFENEPDPRVFDVYLCTLRSQLAACGADASIETVRGAGFRFVETAHDRVAA